jgi:DNA-3-methyladenine glycosylase II
MELDIQEHLSQDPVLASLLDKIPFSAPSPESKNIYHSLLRSVAHQQLSTKAANTIFNRFLDLFPDRDPAPERVSAMPIEDLRSAGLSRQKASYLIHIAEFWMVPENKNTDWHALDDEEIVRRLTRIKGVGIWTAHMILMSSLRRPDVFPHLDQGLLQAIKICYGLGVEGKMLRQASIEIAENWRPYRSHACIVLWQWYDAMREEKGK